MVLLPANLQAFNGNITFFRCLDHVLDEIVFFHGFSGLQVQCQIFGPVHPGTDENSGWTEGM